jgi:Mg2+/Co2+ transporter CorC
VIVALVVAAVSLLALFGIHRQAAARMLLVDPEATEAGILDQAEAARPALVWSEVLIAALFVAVAAHWSDIAILARIGLGALVLVGGLMLPLPRPGSRPGRAPFGVRLFAPLGGADDNGNGHGNGHGQPTTSPERVNPLDERVLLGRMLRFRETEITEVMVPRSDVAAIGVDDSIDTLLARLEETRHSRYPVYEGDLDHVVGIITAFDLLRLPPGTPSFRPHVRPAMIVPEGKRCTDLLEEMMQGGRAIALVVDEYGGTAGLVTAEDLVEELVGEIWDEHERESVLLRRVGRQVYVAQAQIPVEELRSRVGLELPEGDYETLAGFLLEEFGRIPVRGDHVAWKGAKFEVLTADRRRIQSVQITLSGTSGGTA